ncbi:membrane protein [Achromatium sp. WMS1]|nr:membrane protein [Achromatium sp. WMS1]
MRLQNYLIIATCMAIQIGITGCATEGVGGGDYTRTQTRGEQTVLMGEVIAVRVVKIEGTRSGIGTLAGAAIGGLGGSQIGHGAGSTAAAIGGAVIGGIAGQAAEQMATKQDGLEITVALDNGRTIAVTQGIDEQFRVGDRVRVLRGGGTTRVSH